jgi:hypothetical protein
LCGEVENNGIGIVGEAGECLLYGMLVTEIASMDVHLVSEVADVPEFATRCSTNKDVYIRVEIDETFYEMGANEPITSSYKYRTVSKSIREIHVYWLCR